MKDTFAVVHSVYAHILCYAYESRNMLVCLITLQLAFNRHSCEKLVGNALGTMDTYVLDADLCIFFWILKRCIIVYQVPKVWMK